MITAQPRVRSDVASSQARTAPKVPGTEKGEQWFRRLFQGRRWRNPRQLGCWLRELLATPRRSRRLPAIPTIGPARVFRFRPGHAARADPVRRRARVNSADEENIRLCGYSRDWATLGAVLCCAGQFDGALWAKVKLVHSVSPVTRSKSASLLARLDAERLDCARSGRGTEPPPTNCPVPASLCRSRLRPAIFIQPFGTVRRPWACITATIMASPVRSSNSLLTSVAASRSRCVMGIT